MYVYSWSVIIKALIILQENDNIILDINVIKNKIIARLLIVVFLRINSWVKYKKVTEW